MESKRGLCPAAFSPAPHLVTENPPRPLRIATPAAGAFLALTGCLGACTWPSVRPQGPHRPVRRSTTTELRIPPGHHTPRARRPLPAPRDAQRPAVLRYRHSGAPSACHPRERQRSSATARSVLWLVSCNTPVLPDPGRRATSCSARLAQSRISATPARIGRAAIPRRGCRSQSGLRTHRRGRHLRPPVRPTTGQGQKGKPHRCTP